MSLIETCFCLRLYGNLNSTWSSSTNIFVPGYLGIMVTRQVQFCCIFAVTKDKFDHFLKKLLHSITWHIYHHNSSWFLSRHKNIRVLQEKVKKYYIFTNYFDRSLFEQNVFMISIFFTNFWPSASNFKSFFRSIEDFFSNSRSELFW